MNAKINYIHERALRLVYGDYTISFEELLIKDKSVSIHHRNIQKVAIEMFKVKNYLCPEFIFCEVSTQTRSKASFRRHNANNVYKGEMSLRSFGPLVWNTMVPDNLKQISELDFKEEIRHWVPKNCPCRLCKVYVPKIGFVTLFE